MDAATFDAKLVQFLKDLSERHRTVREESIAALKATDHVPRNERRPLISKSVMLQCQEEPLLMAIVELETLFGKGVA